MLLLNGIFIFYTYSNTYFSWYYVYSKIFSFNEY